MLLFIKVFVMKKINNILKIVLAIISIIVACIQFTTSNYILVFYWILVAIYWITNYFAGKK